MGLEGGMCSDGHTVSPGCSGNRLGYLTQVCCQVYLELSHDGDFSCVLEKGENISDKISDKGQPGNILITFAVTKKIKT